MDAVECEVEQDQVVTTLRKSAIVVSLTSVVAVGLWAPDVARATIPRTAHVSIAALTRPGTIWVANAEASGNDEVLIFAPGSSGNVAPEATLSGNTPMSHITGLAVDARGALIVGQAPGTDSILEYAPGATGTAVPSAIITGDKTDLSNVSSVALAPSGNIWASNASSSGLTEFSSTQDGNVAPIDEIDGEANGLIQPDVVAVSANGKFVYAGNRDEGGTSASIAAWSSTASGSAAPLGTIAGIDTGILHTTGMWINPDSSIIAADYVNAVERFAPGAHGNVTPASTISGPKTKLGIFSKLAVGAADDLWLTDTATSPVGVVHFPAGAHGNVAPRLLGGNKTGITEPAAIAILKATPSAPRHVRSASGRKRATVSWTAPATTGGGLTGYLLRTSRTKSGPWTTSALTASTKSVVKHLVNGKTYYAEVQAQNSVGYSRFSAPIRLRPGVPPSAPRSVAAAPSSHSLKISWRAPSSSGTGAIAGYVITAAACRIGAKHCKAKSAHTKKHKLTVELTGLVAKKTYRVEVQARSAYGLGSIRKITIKTT